VISSTSSRALVLVIPTNEELVIASAARSLSQGLVS
jgi:acetate kinase